MDTKIIHKYFTWANKQPANGKVKQNKGNKQKQKQWYQYRHKLNQKRKKVMFVKNRVTQFSKNIADLSGAFSF